MDEEDIIDDDNKVDEEDYGGNGGGCFGGVIGLIFLIGIAWWGFNQFIATNYEVPWWDGTEYQTVCVISNPTNDNCYTLLVTSQDKEIVELEFPNGGYVATYSMDCGKAITFDGQYSVVTDSEGRVWQVQNN